ncbi:hypothetical protein BGY98DRAFT_469098 [Russula aff. rugulosa BPL654]|nr:hypothetical protein BGY98DRAFT_469098 [Russula aff. rugulosa BPL654]
MPTRKLWPPPQWGGAQRLPRKRSRTSLRALAELAQERSLIAYASRRLVCPVLHIPHARRHRAHGNVSGVGCAHFSLRNRHVEAYTLVCSSPRAITRFIPGRDFLRFTCEHIDILVYSMRCARNNKCLYPSLFHCMSVASLWAGSLIAFSDPCPFFTFTPT